MFSRYIIVNSVGRCINSSTYVSEHRFLFPRVVPITKINAQYGKDSCDKKKKKDDRVTYKPYVAQPIEEHDYKNRKLKRPMSPHLTIYAPTLPAMTSIAQRITGTILTSYALFLAGGTLFLSNGIDTYVSIIQSLDLSRISRFLIKLMLGLPFAYHYFNGIRFCAWNAGKYLEKADIYRTARLSFIATAVATIFFTLL